MKDIQGLRDHRRIAIRKVGVKHISYPITVLDRAHRLQRTVATVNMYVNLPHHFKGTHMSRFVEILNRFRGEINLASLRRILEEMKEKLQAEAAHLEIDFPYFMPNRAPRPDGIGLHEYRCRMHGSLAERDDLTLEVRVPIAPPRPDHGDAGLPRSLGHWGVAEIALRSRHFIWIEDLIELVTEVTGHDLRWPPGPDRDPEPAALSVESLARALGRKLRQHPDIGWFSVRVENFAEGYHTFAMTSSAPTP